MWVNISLIPRHQLPFLVVDSLGLVLAVAKLTHLLRKHDMLRALCKLQQHLETEEQWSCHQGGWMEKENAPCDGATQVWKHPDPSVFHLSWIRLRPWLSHLPPCESLHPSLFWLFSANKLLCTDKNWRWQLRMPHAQQESLSMVWSCCHSCHVCQG